MNRCDLEGIGTTKASRNRGNSGVLGVGVFFFTLMTGSLGGWEASFSFLNMRYNQITHFTHKSQAFD